MPVLSSESRTWKLQRVQAINVGTLPERNQASGVSELFRKAISFPLDAVERRRALLQQHARLLRIPSARGQGPCRQLNDKGELPAGNLEEMSLVRCAAVILRIGNCGENSPSTRASASCTASFGCMLLWVL